MATDIRTGQPYVDKDWGHGDQCQCQPCVEKTLSDMAEAGILAFEGIDPESGDPLYKLNEE